MKKLMLLFLLLLSLISNAQNKVYHAEREKINELIHTKLKVDFNYTNSTMNGEAWLTVSPYFYPTDKLNLDAKAFTILDVKVNNKKAAYNYTDDELTITLDKIYKKGEKYIIYVKYIANPENVKQQGSSAITDAKGLYFINPKGTEPNKPIEIWTQGETESNSCWFPTIDAPNQKSTGEIYMTVPSKYVTLSNGILVSQTNNSNGTRTDYWKMDDKIAPYLFFMGVGDFSIIKDSWNGKEVNYYVEKEYASVAKEIFGNTPEMISFFSNITGVPYAWNKYDQIVVRDYVSGAMENVTAVVHAEQAQQKKGQLIDENRWESTISHELFHHWFGDLVTTESWSNLTLNESFATYGSYLWSNYKYGSDRANAELYENLQQYLGSKTDEDKDLVRFYYNDREDMFDLVSYQKGSLILHMLRNYLGDDAFFQSLHNYLENYKFGTAEVPELRLEMEKVSGKDLNWFFNQWYYGNGHIKLTVTYDYNMVNKTVTININQKDKVFKFPLSIDIYGDNSKITQNVWIDKVQNSFTFGFNKVPKLINLDPNHILLAEIDDKKTIDNYLFQYTHAKHYVDRRLALEAISKEQQTNKEAFNTLVKGLDDPYYELRIFAVESLNLFQKYNKQDVINKLVNLANSDPKTLVRAAAISVLGKLVDPAYKSLFEKNIQSESFAVKNSSLISLYLVDKANALSNLNTMSEETKEDIPEAVTTIYILEKNKSQLPFIAKHVLKGMFLTDDPQTQQNYTEAFKWIAQSDNKEAIKNLTNQFVEYAPRYKKFKFDQVAVNLINQMIYLQQQSSNSNKDELILILKTGLAKII